MMPTHHASAIPISLPAGWPDYSDRSDRLNASAFRRRLFEQAEHAVKNGHEVAAGEIAMRPNSRQGRKKEIDFNKVKR